MIKKKIIKGTWFDGKIVNKKIDFSRNSCVFKEKKSGNITTIKKGATQEYFFYENNETGKKPLLKHNRLNFDPTSNNKMETIFIKAHK